MPRKPKERGRPVEHPLPPRIDATPEEIAEAFFRFPMDQELPEREYRCRQCGEVIHYPAVLDRDERCSRCARAPSNG